MSKANTPASRKAKGRRASQEVKEIMLRLAAWSGLSDADIEVKPSGVTGEDLYMSPAARKIYPYTLEVKCQESLSIWSAIEQAEGHAKGTDYVPLLVFKRNNGKPRVVLDFEWFLKLVRSRDAEELL